MDFIWRKKYKQFLLVIAIIGIFFLGFVESIMSFVSINIDVTAESKILIAIYFTTLIVLIWYTRETADMKEIQNKQIKEIRKTRCLEKMPFIRVVSMEVAEKKQAKKEDLCNPKNPSIKDACFYKIGYKNFGKDFAIIEQITLWVDNALASQDKHMFAPNSFAKTVFEGEESYAVSYEIKRKGNVILYPVKVEIVFFDKYGHKFVYNVEREIVLAEPTPYLGVRDTYNEIIEYPKELQ